MNNPFLKKTLNKCMRRVFKNSPTALIHTYLAEESIILTDDGKELAYHYLDRQCSLPEVVAFLIIHCIASDIVERNPSHNTLLLHSQYLGLFEKYVLNDGMRGCYGINNSSQILDRFHKLIVHPDSAIKQKEAKIIYDEEVSICNIESKARALVWDESIFV